MSLALEMFFSQFNKCCESREWGSARWLLGNGIAWNLICIGNLAQTKFFLK
jgi:hypothetical protein